MTTWEQIPSRSELLNILINRTGYTDTKDFYQGSYFSVMWFFLKNIYNAWLNGRQRFDSVILRKLQE